MNQTHLELRDNIAVITLDRPPINSLGLEIRTAIFKAYQQAMADDGVQAIVLASSAKIFCSGADIGEFGTDLLFAEPALPYLCNTLEDSKKIIVAAINGMALGGGCELALACDYRIALPETKLGLPEVNLGILPGAGGTQRLPRLAGVQKALEMIVSGKPATAKEMLNAGVIDRVYNGASGDFIDAAISYAKELVNSGAPVKTCADMAVDTSRLPAGFFADFRAGIARRTHGFFAPERCIQAIEAAANLPFYDGLKKESELCRECMETPQARAQQHIFFAERAVTKIPGLDKNTPVRSINKVAIIGAGTMGGGIAMNFMNAGIETTLLDLDLAALERGVGVIRNNYQISVKKGRFTQQKVEQTMSLLKSTIDYADIAEADLVIEAVFEAMDIKKQVFQTLDAVCKPAAILATNTSTLDVDEIASVTRRPEEVVGLHFFSPANVMRLLEIVRAAKTSVSVLMTTMKMAQQIKKIPVVAGVCWGFIGNRALEPYGREAARLILEGASPTQIDKVLTDFGMAMGFCSMLDLAGIDVSYLARQGHRDALYSKDPHYAAILDALYDLERFGQKTGRGFYLYQGRDKQEDPELMPLSLQLATKAGVAQRAISDQEVLERMIFMLINEGAQILDEGIACRSSDIDVVYCNGYGFPVYRGGPMQYADEIGLARVLEAIKTYREALGAYGEQWFQPAALLEKLVAEGKTFADWSAQKSQKT